MTEEKRTDEAEDTPEPPEPATEVVSKDPDLDLEVERIDTQGVLKEGFAGQEM